MAARLARAIGASVAASLALASWHAQAIILVRDGQPNAVIVVSAEAFAASAWDPSVSVSANEAAKVRLAAADLQQYILRMSGALLPIVEERSAAIAAAPALVLVGSSRATGGMRLRIPQGITRDRKEEGFVLRVERHALVLAGNDAGPYNGTYFAVAEFLERQGVRWFMPGEFGEQVPRKPTIEASDALDERHSPDFIVRAWSGNLAPELRAEEAIWRLRNRLTIDADAVLALPTDSSLRNYLPDADVARAHPELFARRADGSVDEHMPSLSNPAMAAMVAGKLKAQIRLRRAADASFASIGISPDDGLPVDLAPETTRRSLAFTDPLGRQGVAEERSISEEWFRFVGAVIAEVAKEFPDVIVTTSAYSNRMTPPEGVAIPANMGIMFAAIWADMLHAYDDPKSWQQALHGAALRRWAAVSPHVLVYNYDEPMLVNALTALPLTRRIVPTRALRGVGASWASMTSSRIRGWRRASRRSTCARGFTGTPTRTRERSSTTTTPAGTDPRRLRPRLSGIASKRRSRIRRCSATRTASFRSCTRRSCCRRWRRACARRKPRLRRGRTPGTCRPTATSSNI